MFANQQQQQVQDDSLQDITCSPQDQPTDTVASINWVPIMNTNLFSCACWDGKVRLYQLMQQNYGQSQVVSKGLFDLKEPVLSCSWKSDASLLFAGSADGSVKAIDANTGNITNIGQHQSGVKEVFWIQEMNSLVSLSFDKTVKFWQLGQQNAVLQQQLEYKVFAADYNYPYIVVGTQNEKLVLIDLKSIQQNKQYKYTDSPLGPESQISCISLFLEKDGFGVGTVDGRANLSQVQQDGYGQMKINTIMTFKCHKIERQENNKNNQYLYPVNSIGFNPRQKKYLYTCGGEGSIYFWDYEAKNKIKSFNFSQIPVSAARCSPDGAYFAYSLGYDFHKGLEGMDQYRNCNKICIHPVMDAELKYKQN